MKAAPGERSYGTYGAGSTAHLGGELFSVLSGTRSIHVPFKGGAPAIAALLAGDITAVFGTVPAIVPYLKSGQLRALGVTSPERLAELPDVPTVAETLPNYAVNLWWVFVVPAGTPKQIITKLNQEITAATNAPDAREKLSAQGYNFLSGSPEDAAAYLQSEGTKWAQVIKSAQITLE